MPRNAVTSALLTVCTPHPVLHPSSENTARASLICINAYVVTQKKFTVDFLSKKMKANEGEVPQYYIEQSHEPIIDPVEFELVQAELAASSASDVH